MKEKRGARLTKTPGDQGDHVHLLIPRDTINRIERRRRKIQSDTGEYPTLSFVIRQLLRDALTAAEQRDGAT